MEQLLRQEQPFCSFMSLTTTLAGIEDVFALKLKMKTTIWVAIRQKTKKIVTDIKMSVEFRLFSRSLTALFKIFRSDLFEKAAAIGSREF